MKNPGEGQPLASDEVGRGSVRLIEREEDVLALAKDVDLRQQVRSATADHIVDFLRAYTVAGVGAVVEAIPPHKTVSSNTYVGALRSRGLTRGKDFRMFRQSKAADSGPVRALYVLKLTTKVPGEFKLNIRKSTPVFVGVEGGQQ